MILALKAAFLGVVQGLTEFIPVSSSGHLVLFPKLFGWSDPGLAFDVALHLGTVLAILVYFRSEWASVVRGIFTSLRVRPSEWDFPQRVAWLLVLATIPAAVAGVALEGVIENNLRSVASVGVFLAAGSTAMVLAEVLGRKNRTFDELRTRDAASMGALQVLALAPGMSRSGITMSAGMTSGLNREAAAHFSFMMAAPVIGGAGLLEGIKVAQEGLEGCPVGMMVVGSITSAVVGSITIKYLLSYLKRGTLAPFIAYGFAVALAILLALVLS
ncbi:MAG: undecaprenyl-diphosphatase UppP [Actinobacteria bacterium]|nr:undecaprenyl-diphosphatase UppP [Actinomycetota bacterium]MBU4490434.1 undecaprenyl-diphosphatase UppP [Actinomycetota bacterium]MCG2794608.1 undecaprenyl-diphosphatase UppP [Actinomycetes bacterium]